MLCTHIHQPSCTRRMPTLHTVLDFILPALWKLYRRTSCNVDQTGYKLRRIGVYIYMKRDDCQLITFSVVCSLPFLLTSHRHRCDTCFPTSSDISFPPLNLRIFTDIGTAKIIHVHLNVEVDYGRWAVKSWQRSGVSLTTTTGRTSVLTLDLIPGGPVRWMNCRHGKRFILKTLVRWFNARNETF